MRILIGVVLAVAILGGTISEASARSLEEKRAIRACQDSITEMAKAAEHTMSVVIDIDEQYNSTGGLSHWQAKIVYAKVQNYVDQAFFKMRKITNWAPNASDCKRTAEHFMQMFRKTALAEICGFEPRYCPNGQ